MAYKSLGQLTNFGYKRGFEDQYKVGRTLGSGAFGTTYEAVQKSTGKTVAAKAIAKKEMQSASEVADVKREVAILQRLKAIGLPGVVQVIDALESDEFVYIIMELCRGGELCDRIVSTKDMRYSEADAAAVVRQILEVVAACHLNGIVHRDLKPENFLYETTAPDAPLKASDFGLSNFREPGVYFSDLVGTVFYVAPEVLKRRSGPESDVWSVGIIAYILLCGMPPFWEESESGVFDKIKVKEPEFTEAAWASVSDKAKDFVKYLLVKDPASRPTAAQALSHAWLVETVGQQESVPLDIAILNNMREFIKYSRLKKIALKALATTLSEDEIRVLKDQFKAIDGNGDGTITLDEIRQAMNKDLPFPVHESRILSILQSMDDNSDGILDFDEFVSATVHAQQLVEAEDSEAWQQRSKAAFDRFDQDGSGFVDAEELRIFAKVKGSINYLLNPNDMDHDGKLSLPEFQAMLRKVLWPSKPTS